MIPTVQWMRMAFHKFNNQYFGGKLAEPRFDTNPPQGDWGHYKPQAYVKRGVVTKLLGPGIISLTTKYSRSEKDVISTLLHEMIHMYTITCLGIYPNDQHDFNFQQMRQRKHISITFQRTGLDLGQLHVYRLKFLRNGYIANTNNANLLLIMLIFKENKYMKVF